MLKKLSLFILMLFLYGCSAAFVPVTNNPDTKINQAYELLSVYRAIPARRLIDEAIEIYKQQGNTERLAYAYMASTDYYRYIASPAYRNYDPKPTLTVEPVSLMSVLGVRSENVLAAHKLAEETYNKIINDAIQANNHIKASEYYNGLFMLYGRNAQIPEACKALSGELEQFHLAIAAEQIDKSQYASIPDAIAKSKKAFECEK